MDIDYENYYRNKDYGRRESTFRNIFQKRFNLIWPRVGALRGQVLDIGCSTGTFLGLFMERQWEVWGVEPSHAAKVARKKGIRVIKNTFEKARLPRNYFDLVILNHTLEHMIDPLKVLKKAGRLLKKGGVVFVDVPNVASLSSRILGEKWPYLLPEEHKWQFTRKSLQEVFEKAGFKVAYLGTRSGIFEYANPWLELGRKRFVLDLITIPYSFLATALDMGDSMSFIAKKI